MPRTEWLVLLACAAAVAAARNDCGACHRRESESLAKAEMGIGIEVAPAQPLLAAHPKLAGEANGYRYEIVRQGNRSVYTVRSAEDAISVPIRYAFGVDNETFVLEYQGRYYESLVSYYAKVGGLAVTVGDERLRPRSLVEAMGRETSNEEITACFNCHGSGGVAHEQLALGGLEAGVSCVHCHEGAETHAAAARSGGRAALPSQLAGKNAEEMSNFCGQCHRTWAQVIEQRLFSPVNVRFQPYRLANSKCFLGNDRRIRCTACHDPHAKLDRATPDYDHACLACHQPRKGEAAAGAAQKPCPVADSNCVTCHMPKVDLPGGVSTFTDHFIRVVRPGDAYPD